jgi:photosystem II stability/assembly factor-like uncharacterized protein
MIRRVLVRLASRTLCAALMIAAGGGPLLAQGVIRGIAGPAGGPRAALTPPVNAASDPLLRGFQWRSIGPLTMGGRADEIAVVEIDPRVFYVGYATGGLWKTVNAGTTFEPLFDTYSTASIGSVAVSQSDPNVVWVGTGEGNNRQSSSFGDGVYRSTDAGASFTHMGLRETQSIHRLVVHPRDPDIVYVAAVGHLFGPNPERGVFKTTDGGRTWDHVLFVNDDTGATDLVMDPSNPEILYAATYQRRRTGWGFNGGGEGSGIWKTEDAGANWTRLSGNGLPTGTMGRIGLDVSRSNPNVVYAIIEVAPDQEPSAQNAPDLDPQRSGIWRSNDKGRSWEFRGNENNRPMYYSLIRVDPNDENVVYTGGGTVSRSEDGARTFAPLPGVGFVHVDHHHVWINPADSDHLMVVNDGSFDVSYDRGFTFESFRTISAAQFYHITVDQRTPYYVCGGLQDNGSWCGPSAVRGLYISADAWYRVGGGDGTYSAVDPTDYNIVYSAGQNGNARRTDLAAPEPLALASERIDAVFLRGTPIRPLPPRDDGTGGNVLPEPTPGEIYRWNWSTPFLLSHHNPRTLYFGGNRLFKSVDRGDTWSAGNDLTKRIDRDELEIMGVRGGLPRCGDTRGEQCILSKNDGVSFFGTMTTIAESPLRPGILWAGSDDGNIQVSRDDNRTWTEVSRNLSGGGSGCWVSRVEASYFDEATAYVSLDCHRSNDLRPYVYVTRDFGESWTSITSDLPSFGNVNVVKQDPRNERVLYVGTEFGFYVSLDEGGSWRQLMTGLPTVRVDDVVVHPREGDLVLGTHGRGALIMDDITPLQQMTDDVLSSDVHLFELRNAVRWLVDVRLARGSTGVKKFYGRNPLPGTAIHYYLREPATGAVRVTVHDAVTGEVFRELEGPGEAGLNRIQWDLRGEQPPAAAPGGGRGGRGGRGGSPPAPLATAGSYRVVLSVNGRELSRVVVVEEDVWMDQRE